MRKLSLAVLVFALLLAAAAPFQAASAAGQASLINRTGSGLVKADPLTSGDLSYWRFYGDIVTQTPAPSLDHQAQVSTNSGQKVPALGLGTNNPNEVIFVLVSLTCGNSASCSRPPTVQSVSSTPALTWNLRNSASNGPIAIAEYYAIAGSKGNWNIAITASASCACVVTAFGVSNADPGNPFDKNAGASGSSTGTGSSPGSPISTTTPNDMMLGFLVQGAATPPPNLKATPESGFQTIVQRTTGDNGNPQPFNVQGADEFELAPPSESAFPVSFTTSGSYPWVMLVDAVSPRVLYTYAEDAQGLHIGVTASATGTYGGLYAVSPNSNAALFHAAISLPYTKTTANNYNTGLYVQTSSSISYVFCGASVYSTGYSWSVVETTGSSTTATKFTTLWSEAGGPLLGDCTIVTNGNNELKVYLNGAMVYSSSSLNMQMPAPFNTYLEVETSYTGAMLFGTYNNYYATSSEYVTLQSAPSGGTADVVDSSGNVLSSAVVNQDGNAFLPVGALELPIAGNVEVFDAAHNLVASTGPGTSIYGGDVFAVTGSPYGGPTPPSPPTGLTATTRSSSQIDLAWTAPASDGGSAITGYMIQRSAGGGPFVTIVSNTGTTSTSYSDAKLSASTTYSYRVSAINSVGASPVSSPASATTSPSTTSRLAIYSQLTSGSAVSGFYAILSQSGSQVATGFTPATFTLSNGQSYTVAVENYGNYYFGYWLDTLSTNPSRSISISSNTTLTAVYCSGPCPPPPPPSGQSTITVSTINSSGQTITGYYITIWQSGIQVGSCFSSCSFTVNDGETFQLAATGYGSEAFNHWQNDGSTGFETVVVPSSSTVLQYTAVYSP